jgi:hypothetical protein
MALCLSSITTTYFPTSKVFSFFLGDLGVLGGSSLRCSTKPQACLGDDLLSSQEWKLLTTAFQEHNRCTAPRLRE